jgi:protoporphyrin/coproporphyrin ferrochelatase
MADTAILLLAHGTPETLDDIPEYLRNVTSGRPMPEHVVAEIRHRYGLIGGSSPLTELTEEQGRLLNEKLAVPVYVGMRNWKPYIVDVVKQMREDGVRSAVAICLAPQNSRTSVGLYRRAVQAEAGELVLDFVDGWADHPLLADAFADRLRPVWQRLCEETSTAVPVLFTAHSVPCRTIQVQPPVEGQRPAGRPQNIEPDPYPQETKRTAALVAERIEGLKADNWFFAFQSQGMSGGPWIGPTVEETLSAIRSAGHTTVILQPIGFLCDHVEILYDVDILFREMAAKIGLRLERPASLNDSPLLTATLADLAGKGLERLGARQLSSVRR